MQRRQSGFLALINLSHRAVDSGQRRIAPPYTAVVLGALFASLPLSWSSWANEGVPPWPVGSLEHSTWSLVVQGKPVELSPSLPDDQTCSISSLDSHEPSRFTVSEKFR
jgi:hypothetical protein